MNEQIHMVKMPETQRGCFSGVVSDQGVKKASYNTSKAKTT